MPVVLDISSDEEQGSEEGITNIDFDWIKEMLDMSDDDEKSDDSDVVIIHEKKGELKLKSSTPVVKDVDNDNEDDDDCVVLDGDPENGVTSVDEDATGSDELAVVGEKGQIACRDYPHARHLCAKFPFSSTPHERHCDQCHCYVCDSLAPCLKWGSGFLSTDHCHANDKTEIWKIQRKNLKLGDSSPLPASTNRGNSVRAVRPRCNDFRTHNIIRLPPNSMLKNQASRTIATLSCSSLNSIPQNQASRPTAMCNFAPSPNSILQNQVSRLNNIPLYSTSTNLTIPNGANRGRCPESGSTLARNRYQPHSLQRESLGVRSHAIQKERGSGVSSLRPQFLRSPMMSKGVSRAGDAWTVNHHARGSSGFSNHVNPIQQCGSYHTAAGFSNDKNSNELSGVWLPPTVPLYPLPSSEPANMSCVDQYTVASDSQVCSDAFSQSNDGQHLYQSCIQGNDAPSYGACLNSDNQHGSEHQIRSQNENSCRNSTQCGIGSQDTYQPEPQEESPHETARRGDDFSALDSSWTENNSESIEPLIECSHPQSSASTYHCGSIEPQIESSHLPSAIVDIEKWLFEQDPLPVVTDGALLSELNIPSPDLSPVIDTGMPLSQLW